MLRSFPFVMDFLAALAAQVLLTTLTEDCLHLIWSLLALLTDELDFVEMLRVRVVATGAADLFALQTPEGRLRLVAALLTFYGHPQNITLQRINQKDKDQELNSHCEWSMMRPTQPQQTPSGSLQKLRNLHFYFLTPLFYKKISNYQREGQWGVETSIKVGSPQTSLAMQPLGKR